MRCVESVIAVERAKGLDERGAVGQVPHGHDAGRQLPHAAATQSADQVFGQHGQPFLQLFVTGQPGIQLLKRLQAAVVIRQQVGADLVGQQRLDARRRQAQVRIDQQLAARHDQSADVAGNLCLRLEFGTRLPIEIELRLGTLGEGVGSQLLPLFTAASCWTVDSAGPSPDAAARPCTPPNSCRLSYRKRGVSRSRSMVSFNSSSSCFS